MADYDKVLSDLTARAQQAARSPDEKDKEKFEASLLQLASSSNTSPELRQAAMQLRLPDVNVSRNEEGNLSFSRPITTNPQLPRDFAAKTTVVAPGETAIVGNEDKMAIMQGAPMRSTFANKTPNDLNVIGNSAASPMVKSVSAQIMKINELSNPTEKQRAFLNLSESINLARTTRQIELINQKERELGVPQLEQQLIAEEEADHADSKWQQNQVDSPITAQIRQRLRVAKADAATYGERDIKLDPVLTQLDAEVRKTQGLIELEATQQGSATDIAYSTSSPEEQRMAKIATAAIANKPVDQVTNEEATKYLNNPFVQSARTMSEPELLAKSIDPMDSNASQYGEVLKNLGTIDDVPLLQEHMKAMQQIVNVKGNMEDMPTANAKVRALAQDPRVRELVAQSNQKTLAGATETKEERAARDAYTRMVMAKTAIQMYMEDKINAIESSVMELPKPSDPALIPVWQSVTSKGAGLGQFMNDEAIDNLLDVTDATTLQNNINAIMQYVLPIYRSKAPTPVSDVDPMVTKEQKLRVLLQTKAARLEERAVNIGGSFWQRPRAGF